jgi:hypothetical protein
MTFLLIIFSERFDWSCDVPDVAEPIVHAAASIAPVLVLHGEFEAAESRERAMEHVGGHWASTSWIALILQT